MSYADLLNQTPPANRTSTDRLISPPRPPHRGSLTPNWKANLSQSEFNIPPIPKSPLQRQSSARFKSSLCKPLFPTNSQEVFGSPIRRQSSGCGSDFSTPPSPSSKTRFLPAKPSHRIPLENIPSDFYLSPIDWSKDDVIAMALSNITVFINPKTAESVIPVNTPIDPTCVKFAPDGDSLGIGNEEGELMLYSPSRQTPLASYGLFESSVLCSDWSDNIVISGGKCGMLSVLDTREEEAMVYTEMHLEEICSVNFARDSTRIATSSNDCTAKIWDMRSFASPITVYEEHCAAVRAVQWSPMSNELIATGGGTSDKNIRIWNVETGETISQIDTGSQVCNLYWNEEYNEILSTHGFSQNHLALWKGSDLSPIAQLHEHRQRVLFMAVSPDHTRVATAAPDDDLLIWKMFPSKRLSLTQSMLLLR